MKIKFSFKIAVCLMLASSFSLDAFTQSFCKTKASPDKLKAIPQSLLKSGSDNYTVRLAIHIMKRTDGSGGRSYQEVDKLISILNEDFKPQGICFKVKIVDEIKSDQYFDGNFFDQDFDGDGKFDGMHVNANYDAVDIYYYPSDRYNSGLAAEIGATAFVIGGIVFGEDLGVSKVLSHELGHCFGLRHTFAGTCESIPNDCPELADGSNCVSCGDFVCDTPADPTQFNMDLNSCSYTGQTCTGNSTDANGVPYNPRTDLIMSYIAPHCMETFTDGQGERMKNFIENLTILQAVTTDSTYNLYTKDNIDDFGVEPNNSPIYPWLSTDIWVRRSQGVGNRVHQNPEHSSTNNPAQLNYVYVSVRNAGCETSQPNDSVYLHWAKASTALTYPLHWYGNINLQGGNNPKAGNIIGGIKIDPPIQPGEERVFEFTWNPPSPNDYSFNDEPWHFCLLSRIASNSDPITDYSDIGQFVVNNNNVAWKNLSVIDSVAGIVVNDDDECITDLFELRSAAIGVGNFTQQAETYNLSFSVPVEETEQSITQYGIVLISLTEGLYDKWVQGGRQGSGFTELNPHNGIVTTLIGSTPLHDILFGTHRKVFQINDLNVEFKNIALQAGENYTAAAMVLYPSAEVSSHKVFNYDAIQRVASTNQLVGGVRYQMYKPNCPAVAMGAGANQNINLGCEATLTATNQQLCGTYEWTNQFGNVVSREASFTTRPLQTNTYNLKAVSPEGCVSNSQVTVNVNNQLCSPQTPISCFNDVSIYPNPSSSNTLTINLLSEINVQASITIRNVLFGNVVKQVNTLVSVGQNSIPVDISGITKGLYQIRITCPNSLQTPYIGLFNRQ